MPLGEGTDITRDFAGRLHVRLRVAAGRVGAVGVDSTRPADAARVFSGRLPAEAVALMSMVFSLCARAQTIAGLRALEAAGGLRLPAPIEAAREILRLSEMLSQTALRVGLDWPRLLDVEARADVVRGCLGAEAEFERALFGVGHWKTPGGAPFEPSPEAVRAIAEKLDERLENAITRSLAPALRHALAAAGLEGFGANDVVSPEAVEDGALKRNWDRPAVAAARATHGAGLRARLEARLVELETLPKAILAAAADLAPVEVTGQAIVADGQGTARVETARGPLVHHVVLEGGRIAHYRIDAPTDANFAPDGIVAAGLSGAVATDPVALKRAAQLHVLAVDPCVSCAVEIEEA